MWKTARPQWAAGYQTGMSGKWHLGNQPPQRPLDRGFDEYYGLMDGAVNFFNPAQPDPDFKGGKAASLQFLIGQIMKLSKGKANPAMAKQMLEKKLSS